MEFYICLKLFSIKISSVFYPTQQIKYPYSHRVNENNLSTFGSSRTDAQKELSVQFQSLHITYNFEVYILVLHYAICHANLPWKIYDKKYVK